MKLKLINQLNSYQAFNTQENLMLEKMRKFLLSFDNCFNRELEIGHFTASAFVINELKNKVLLLHHTKLQKWLQPGGHCDGNPDTLEVARKELIEETGLIPDFIFDEIFDIDIHEIPENKSIMAHLHYDIRYVFMCKESQKIIQNNESNAIKWVELSNLENLTNEESILRMKEKILINKYF